jgi:uncharacterized damage-inducible protein DinB
MGTAAHARPHETEVPPYYRGYVAAVPDGDIVALLTEQIDGTRTLLDGVSEARAAFRYADGKWSIKQVVGHLVDSERVFVYRMLTFARGDETALPGFEQDDWVAAGEFDRRTLADLVAEFVAVREGTVRLLAACSDDQWGAHGTANGVDFSVRAIAWILAGHERHHRAILEERYLGG